jgi:hypothetical protein
VVLVVPEDDVVPRLLLGPGVLTLPAATDRLLERLGDFDGGVVGHFSQFFATVVGDRVGPQWSNQLRAIILYVFRFG